MTNTTHPERNGNEFFILLFLAGMPLVPFFALLNFLV